MKDICAVYGKDAICRRTVGDGRRSTRPGDSTKKTGFETRTKEFWRGGINELVERWEQVVDNEGEHITIKLLLFMP